MRNNPAHIISIEFVAMEEEGTKIQGQVLKQWFSNFETFMVDDECLLIKNPNVAGNFSKTKYVNSGSKLNLAMKASVTKTEDWQGPVNNFDFVPFVEVLNKSLSEWSVIDLIGFVLSYESLEEIFIKKEHVWKSRMVLHLVDTNGVQMDLHLWESYAMQMHAYLTKHPNESSLVIIAQWALYKLFHGKVNLSNTINLSTKLIINDDLPEILQFKNSQQLIEHAGNDASNSLSGPSRKSTTMLKEFLSEFKSCAEAESVIKPTNVVVYGTLIHISDAVSWHYVGCDACNSQVTPNRIGYEGPYVCNKKICKANETNVTVGIRFKLNVRIQDSTGSVKLTLFDNAATKLLKMTAKELYETYVKGESETFPTELRELVGKTLAWKFEITSYNIDNAYHT